MGNKKLWVFTHSTYESVQIIGVYDAEHVAKIKEKFLPLAIELREKEIKYHEINLFATKYKLGVEDIVDGKVDINSLTEQEIENYNKYKKEQLHIQEIIDEWNSRNNLKLVDTYLDYNNYQFHETNLNNLNLSFLGKRE